MNVHPSTVEVAKPGEAMFKMCTLKTKYLTIQSSETTLSESRFVFTCVFLALSDIRTSAVMILDYAKPISIDQECGRTSEQTRRGEKEQRTIQEWVKYDEHVLS